MSTIEFSELKELITEWARKRTEPFSTADVYKEIDAADDVERVSNAIRKLWLMRLVGRKKIDGCRYAYALPEYAPQDYEWAPEKEEIAEQASESLDASATILEMAKQHLDKDQPLSAPIETKPAVNLSPIRKPETKPKKTAEKPPKNVWSDSIRTDDAIQPQIGEIKIPVPENFVLSLQTPGGLVITIKTGIL